MAFDSAEELEEFFDVLRLDPDACIFYRPVQRALLRVEVEAECDFALKGELDSVADQVEEDLLEALHVREDLLGKDHGDLDVEAEPLLLQLEAHDLCHLVHGLPKVKDALEYSKLLVLYPRDIKHVLDHIPQMHRAVIYYSQLMQEVFVLFGVLSL